MQPRVLVACEYSGVVREAFSKMGCYAVSCDLLPTEIPGRHYQGNVLDILDRDWDLIIAYPPCTYLCSSGLHWNDRGRGWSNTEKALEFVAAIMNANCRRICVENPMGCIPNRLKRCEKTNKIIVRYRMFEGNNVTLPYTQVIQPYRFGHDAAKSTCLWLKNLPPLEQTEFVSPRIVDGKYRWSNQTDSGQNILGPSEDRAYERARTYQGIANAKAALWAPLLFV